MYTEEEQLAQIRQWWQRYGKLILLGLVIIVLTAAGWRYWQARRANIAQQASILFDHLLVSRDNSDETALQGQGNYLLNAYSHTLYAQMGAFVLADYAINQNDLSTASEKLQWVLDKGDNPAMRQLARLHLARIQLAEKQYDKAESTLSRIELSNYTARVYGLRGDIAIARQDIATARKEYEMALAKMTHNTELKQLYQTKLDQLPAASN